MNDRVSNIALDRLWDALIAAGYDPAPYVGQQWWETQDRLTPPGHRRILTITGIYKLVSGWTATVDGRQVDQNGHEVPGPYVCGGSIHLDHLRQWCVPLLDEERGVAREPALVAADDGRTRLRDHGGGRPH